MTEQNSQPTFPPQHHSQSPRRLVRSRDDRWLAGVCGGVAEYAGVDANLVRLVVVLGTIFGFGSLLVAYIVAWLLMPEE
jgi:phage shock protein C